jgi:hypothetical protein
VPAPEHAIRDVEERFAAGAKPASDDSDDPGDPGDPDQRAAALEAEYERAQQAALAAQDAVARAQGTAEMPVALQALATAQAPLGPLRARLFASDGDRFIDGFRTALDEARLANDQVYKLLATHRGASPEALRSAIDEALAQAPAGTARHALLLAARDIGLGSRDFQYDATTTYPALARSLEAIQARYTALEDATAELPEALATQERLGHPARIADEIAQAQARVHADAVVQRYERALDDAIAAVGADTTLGQALFGDTGTLACGRLACPTTTRSSPSPSAGSGGTWTAAAGRSPAGGPSTSARGCGTARTRGTGSRRRTSLDLRPA